MRVAKKSQSGASPVQWTSSALVDMGRVHARYQVWQALRAGQLRSSSELRDERTALTAPASPRQSQKDGPSEVANSRDSPKQSNSPFVTISSPKEEVRGVLGRARETLNRAMSRGKESPSSNSRSPLRFFNGAKKVVEKAPPQNQNFFLCSQLYQAEREKPGPSPTSSVVWSGFNPRPQSRSQSPLQETQKVPPKPPRRQKDHVVQPEATKKSEPTPSSPAVHGTKTSELKKATTRGAGSKVATLPVSANPFPDTKARYLSPRPTPREETTKDPEKELREQLLRRQRKEELERKLEAKTDLYSRDVRRIARREKMIRKEKEAKKKEERKECTFKPKIREDWRDMCTSLLILEAITINNFFPLLLSVFNEKFVQVGLETHTSTTG